MWLEPQAATREREARLNRKQAENPNDDRRSQMEEKLETNDTSKVKSAKSIKENIAEHRTSNNHRERHTSPHITNDANLRSRVKSLDRQAPAPPPPLSDGKR